MTPQVRRYTKGVIIPLLVISLVIFVLMLIQRLSSLSVWDDAYMFVRYVDNLLHDGVLSWNPDGQPTFGLTSLAYLLLVIPFRVIFPAQPALVMLLSSLFSGLLVMIALLWLLQRLSSNQVHQLAIVGLLVLSLVVAGESLTTHLTTGMDTMFAMFMFTIWIGLLFRSDNGVTQGAWSGLFFVVRPDLLIFVGCLFPFLFIARQTSRQVWTFIGTFSAILVVQLLLTTLYFGDPIPLPFYIKNTTIYSEQFYTFYNNTSMEFFIEFVRTYPYIIGIILVSLVTRFRQWTWQDRGLLVGCVGFSMYHIFLVVPIMGFSQRFFHPMLPALIILSARSLTHLIPDVRPTLVENLKHFPTPMLLIPILLMFALINPMPIILTLVQYTQPDDIPTAGIGRFDLQISYDYLYRDNWYRLDKLSELDDDIVIATTEIGLPGVFNPEKTIIDLAGLNEPMIALNGFSADWLLSLHNQPDWIYMPFPHYEGMWFRIIEHRNFEDLYHLFPAQSLGTSMDVAIKRSSPYYLEMLDILTNS